MDLVGWYDSDDQSGGNVKELVVESFEEDGTAVYSDERTPKKYYTTHNDKWLTAFEPKYV